MNKKSLLSTIATIFYLVTAAASPPKLIVRADDMGMFHEANTGCLESCVAGISTVVEVMPVGAWFLEAVSMLQEHPHIEVGIHLALTSEWDNVKWRPLTDCPSLADDDGYFLPSIRSTDDRPGLVNRDWSAGEIEAEFRAQIETVLRNIPQANHLTGHMGAMRFHPEVASIADRLAVEYGLMHLESEEVRDRHNITFVTYDGPSGTAQDKEESFIKMLGTLEAGRNYLFLDHPGVDTDEMESVGHRGYEKVRQDRAGVTALFTSQRVKDEIARLGIELTDYAGVIKPLPRTAPQDAGVDPDNIAAFLDAMTAGNIGIHSFMMLKDGNVVAEKWFGDNGPRIPHVMHSVSKTVTASAIGLAIDEGLVNLDDKVIAFFPDKLPQTVSPELSRLTVRHLLTMSVGHDVGAANSIRSSEEDWVRHFLSLPITEEPGTIFNYNSMATYMLSAIIQEVTGEKLLTYLYPRLFHPLGITGIYSAESPQGIQTGGWGMYLHTEDMAKIGQLLLQGGVREGRQVLPAWWIKEASSFQIDSWPSGVPRDNEEHPESDWNLGYGYQMWMCRHGAYRADGANGQFIIVMPDSNAVVAMTSDEQDMQKMLDLVWEYLR